MQYFCGIILSVIFSLCIMTKNVLFLCPSGNKSQREELDSILFLFEVSYPFSIYTEHYSYMVLYNNKHIFCLQAQWYDPK